jgi:hypothetical protein
VIGADEFASPFDDFARYKVAEAHDPSAEPAAGLDNRDGVASTEQFVRGREAGQAGPDHQHSLAGGLAGQVRGGAEAGTE